MFTETQNYKQILSTLFSWCQKLISCKHLVKTTLRSLYFLDLGGMRVVLLKSCFIVWNKRQRKISFNTKVQCFLSHFWVSKWRPKILQWHPKFWKPRYDFALYWSKTIWDKHVFLHVAIATDGCNVIGRPNFLSQKLEAKILSLISVHTGADAGGAIGAIASPTTKESYFIYHDFVQFGKQYSQYNSENGIRNKTWLQNITEIAPPP